MINNSSDDAKNYYYKPAHSNRIGQIWEMHEIFSDHKKMFLVIKKESYFKATDHIWKMLSLEGDDQCAVNEIWFREHEINSNYYGSNPLHRRII